MISPEILNTMRGLLEKEKIHLQDALSGIGKKSEAGEFKTQWEEYGNNEEDNAAEVDAFTNSKGVGDALEQELNAVLAALARMDNGTYGVCDQCKEEISELRLQVRPQALYCVRCQEKMNT